MFTQITRCKPHNYLSKYRESSDGYVDECPYCQIDRLKEALLLLATIAEGSTTANSLPNIAKIARTHLRESI